MPFPQIVLAPTAIAATAVCAVAYERDASSFLRTIAERVGDATFAIYLTHTLVVSPVAKLIAAVAPDMPIWVFVPAAFVLSIAFGLIVHRFVERPLIAAWRRIAHTNRRSRKNSTPTTIGARP